MSAVTVLAAFPFVFPPIAVAAGIAHRPTFDLLTGEDQVGEWLQVVAWAGTLLFAILVMGRLMRDRSGLVPLYLIFALGVFFILGEEISWGQRLFGWGTPEALEEINRQAETNLHNIYGVQTVFSWGMFVVGLYGTLAPLLCLRRWGAYDRWPAAVRRLSPHWLLVPYFLLMLVWRTYRNLFEPIREYYFAISRFGEITELVLAFGFFLFAWHQWRLTRSTSGRALEDGPIAP